MAVVARCNGTEIVDQGGELWIVERPAPPVTALFVLVLLATICGVNAIVQGVLAIGGAPTHALVAALLLVVGGAAGWIAARVRRWGRRRAAVEAPPSLIVDLAGARLLDAGRRELAPLARVRVERVFQLASSSRALALRWPGGARVIARGNPFGDPVDACEAALRARGLG